MTHTDLVTRAARWLRNSCGCGVVLTELRTYAWEEPDAIGWVGGYCIVVECKTSRSDFRADLKKPFRKNASLGLGHWRIYLTQPGLLDGIDIPEGWSWYEVDGRCVRHKAGPKYTNCGPKPHESRTQDEVTMLLSALRRLQSKEVASK